MCANWEEQAWKITDYNFPANNSRPQTQYLVKKALIQKGPLSGVVYSWSHAMTAVGYDYNSQTDETIIIFKNSWGPEYGENGYVRIVLNLNNLFFSYAEGPLVPPSGTTATILCEDKDNDQYCNWGVSEMKPSSCPASCLPEKDIDDSNSLIHGLESFNNVCGDAILAGFEICDKSTLNSVFPELNNKYCQNPLPYCGVGYAGYYGDGSRLGTCDASCSCVVGQYNNSDCTQHCSCPTGDEYYCTNCNYFEDMAYHCHDNIWNCGETGVDIGGGC